MPNNVKLRLEQFRQARRIHGGTVNLCIAAMGVRLSRLPIPSRRMRERVYRTVYGKKYAALCEEELEQPLAEFRSMNALFTRGVRAERRPLPSDHSQLLCPCDGTVQDLGQLHRDSLLTAKGIEYSLPSLLPGVDVGQFADGEYCIVFLSPADCHRVFSPADATLQELIHVPGRRLLVHPPYQRKEFPVFALNERVIMLLDTPLGRCALVMVAGWGVGNITHPFAAKYRVQTRKTLPTPVRRSRLIKPNRRVRMSRRRITRAMLDEPLEFGRGQWLATFELGSTVVLITEPGANLQCLLHADDKVQYGQPMYACEREKLNSQ